MKLSAGTIGIVLFTVAGIAVFVLMAKRPAVDGSAMNFGMPMPSAVVEEKKVKDKRSEAITSTSMPAPATSTLEVEPTKEEEATTMPVSSAVPMSPVSTDTEVKIEEMPIPEVPTTESTESTTN